MSIHLAGGVLSQVRRPQRVEGLPIGCAVLPGVIHLVQFQKQGGRVLAATHPLPGSEIGSEEWWSGLDQALTEILPDWPFAGRALVLSCPPLARAVKCLELPLMSDEEIARAAVWQLAKDLNVQAGDLTCQALSLKGILKEEPANKLEAITFSAPTRTLCRLADVMVAHGLEPVAIDDPLCAMARGIDAGSLQAGSPKDDTLVIVEMAGPESLLAIVRGGDLRLVRRIGLGVAAFDQNVAKRLNVDVVQARSMRLSAAADPRITAAVDQAIALAGQEIARELVMTVRHHMARSCDGWPMGGILLAPEDLAPLADAIGAHVGIQFNPPLALPGAGWGQLDPAVIASTSRRPQDWFIAVGLALYGAQPTWPGAEEAA